MSLCGHMLIDGNVTGEAPLARLALESPETCIVHVLDGSFMVVESGVASVTFRPVVVFVI
jgi:hypothetical protein